MRASCAGTRTYPGEQGHDRYPESRGAHTGEGSPKDEHVRVRGACTDETADLEKKDADEVRPLRGEYGQDLAEEEHEAGLCAGTMSGGAM